MSSQPENILHTYLLAKDGNRPHLMRDVFTPAATLEMVVKSDNIAFPAVSHGLAAITDVLVRRFGQTWENVYTFCLQRPEPDISAYSCNWLVGMSDKASGNVRIGCGRYDWSFRHQAPCLAERLVITIEVMQVLAPERQDDVLGWLRQLPYPWCTAEEIARSAPAAGALEPVLRYIGGDLIGAGF